MPRTLARYFAIAVPCIVWATDESLTSTLLRELDAFSRGEVAGVLKASKVLTEYEYPVALTHSGVLVVAIGSGPGGLVH